jgi:hypothetical protein
MSLHLQLPFKNLHLQEPFLPTILFLWSLRIPPNDVAFTGAVEAAAHPPFSSSFSSTSAAKIVTTFNGSSVSQLLQMTSST